MADYETHIYCAWEKHMLFVMMAHFFTVMLQIALKKRVQPDHASDQAAYKRLPAVSNVSGHKNNNCISG